MLTVESWQNLNRGLRHDLQTRRPNTDNVVLSRSETKHITGTLCGQELCEACHAGHQAGETDLAEKSSLSNIRKPTSTHDYAIEGPGQLPQLARASLCWISKEISGDRAFERTPAMLEGKLIRGTLSHHMFNLHARSLGAS